MRNFIVKPNGLAVLYNAILVPAMITIGIETY